MSFGRHGSGKGRRLQRACGLVITDKRRETNMSSMATIGTRESVADALNGFSDENKSWLQLMMENPKSDDVLLDGLHLFLDRASESRFLNSLKLQKTGEWIGNTAPGRIQIRLMEAAKSSQHPAYQAFREGLVRSGGMERAYPKAPV
jgi:hypothetical protein